MEFSAKRNNLRVSSRKLALLAGLVRGKPVQQAMDALRFNDKQMSGPVLKLLQSAVNNASINKSVDVDKLIVSRVQVDKGPTLKRFMPRARGGASQILKRTSHLTVFVAEK